MDTHTCEEHAWKMPLEFRCPHCVFEDGHRQSADRQPTGRPALELAIKLISAGAGQEHILWTVAHSVHYGYALDIARAWQR